MTKIWVLVLVAVFTVTAVGCKSKQKPRAAAAESGSYSTELKDKIKDAVDDKVRREKLILIVDRADDCMNDVNKVFMDSRAELDADPQAPREKADEVYLRIEAAREKCVRTIVASRVEMRGLVNEQEWNAVFLETLNEKYGADKKPADKRPDTLDNNAPAKETVKK